MYCRHNCSPKVGIQTMPCLFRLVLNLESNISYTGCKPQDETVQSNWPIAEVRRYGILSVPNIYLWKWIRLELKNVSTISLSKVLLHLPHLYSEENRDGQNVDMVIQDSLNIISHPPKKEKKTQPRQTEAPTNCSNVYWRNRPDWRLGSLQKAGNLPRILAREAKLWWCKCNRLIPRILW